MFSLVCAAPGAGVTHNNSPHSADRSDLLLKIGVPLTRPTTSGPLLTAQLDHNPSQATALLIVFLQLLLCVGNFRNMNKLRNVCVAFSSLVYKI